MWDCPVAEEFLWLPLLGEAISSRLEEMHQSTDSQWDGENVSQRRSGQYSQRCKTAGEDDAWAATQVTVASGKRAQRENQPRRLASSHIAQRGRPASQNPATGQSWNSESESNVDFANPLYNSQRIIDCPAAAECDFGSGGTAVYAQNVCRADQRRKTLPIRPTSVGKHCRSELE